MTYSIPPWTHIPCNMSTTAPIHSWYCIFHLFKLSLLANRMYQEKQCVNPRQELMGYHASALSQNPAKHVNHLREILGQSPVPPVKVPAMQKTKLRSASCPPGSHLAGDVCESRRLFQLILRLVTKFLCMLLDFEIIPYTAVVN